MLEIKESQKTIKCDKCNRCARKLTLCTCRIIVTPPAQYRPHGINGAVYPWRWLYNADSKTHIPRENKKLNHQKAADIIAQAVENNIRIVAERGSIFRTFHTVYGDIQAAGIELPINEPVSPNDSLRVIFNAGNYELDGYLQGVSLDSSKISGFYILYKNYGEMCQAIELVLDKYDESRPKEEFGGLEESK